MSTKKNTSPAPEFPCVIETFRRVDAYRRASLVEEEPSCFNGVLSIRKYRITIEEIEEPKEVLIERLRRLWRECDNAHHMLPLSAAAKELGVELDPKERGSQKRRAL